jgi:hypothetical protein
MRVLRTRWCGESGSFIRNQEVGWGRRRAAPWNGKGGGGGRWNKVGVLTQRRLGYMVDLVRKKSRRQRGGKSRIGPATDVSTVRNTGVLGLGFNPNRHIQEKQQEKERASRSGTQEAKEEGKRHHHRSSGRSLHQHNVRRKKEKKQNQI